MNRLFQDYKGTFIDKNGVEHVDMLGYSEEKSSEYSMVDFSAAWISRFYLNQFNQNKKLVGIVDSTKDCESIGKDYKRYP